jgi:hypothetical protein
VFRTNKAEAHLRGGPLHGILLASHHFFISKLVKNNHSDMLHAKSNSSCNSSEHLKEKPPFDFNN